MESALVRRVLAGDHHHDAAHEEEEKLMIARIIMIIVILISGIFIFLPYAKCMQQKEPE